MTRVLEHHAKAVGDATGALELDLAFRHPLFRQHLAQHEGKARSHGVDRDRASLQRLHRRDVLLRRDRQEAVVGGQHGNQVDVRVGRQIGLVLALAVGDNVVDRRETHVVRAGDQVGELVGRAGREVDLYIDLLAGEEALALRHPDRQVESAGEVDHADRLRRAGMLFWERLGLRRLLRVGDGGNDTRQCDGQGGHAAQVRSASRELIAWHYRIVRRRFCHGCGGLGRRHA